MAVSSHTKHGDHHTVSKVFYNDGDRFAHPKIVELPTVGAHFLWRRDIGHIYDRKYRQTYDSSVFQWDHAVGSGQLRFKAELPKGTQLKFSVRSAASQPQLQRQPWRPARGSHRFSTAPTDRCLQYRAVFQSDNGDRYPVLDRVSIELSRKS